MFIYLGAMCRVDTSIIFFNDLFVVVRNFVYKSCSLFQCQYPKIHTFENTNFHSDSRIDMYLNVR